MGTGTAGIERREAVLGAVDEFRRVYGTWLNDNRSDEIEEDSPLFDAIEVMVAVCKGGSTPENCLELVTAVMRLAEEFRQYCAGVWIEPTKAPTPKFHAAVKAVEEARAGAIPPQETGHESVRELLEVQKVSPRQVAIMFGYKNPDTGKWTGPFWQDGRVRFDLIEKESREPHSVIPADWVNPREAEKRRRFEEDMQNRLIRIDQRANDDEAKQAKKFKPKPTEEDVIDYLANEHAFPAMCTKRWDITLDEVMDIAARHGIEVETAEQARKKPPRPPVKQKPLEPSEPDTPAGDTDPQGNGEQAPSLDEQIKAMVLDLAAQKADNAEIRERVAEGLGTEISQQKVAAIIREDKRQAAPAA